MAMKKVDKIGLGPNEEKLGILRTIRDDQKLAFGGVETSHFSASFHPQNNRLFLFCFDDS